MQRQESSSGVGGTRRRSSSRGRIGVRVGSDPMLSGGPLTPTLSGGPGGAAVEGLESPAVAGDNGGGAAARGANGDQVGRERERPALPVLAVLREENRSAAPTTQHCVGDGADPASRSDDVPDASSRQVMPPSIDREIRPAAASLQRVFPSGDATTSQAPASTLRGRCSSAARRPTAGWRPQRLLVRPRISPRIRLARVPGPRALPAWARRGPGALLVHIRARGHVPGSLERFLRFHWRLPDLDHRRRRSGLRHRAGTVTSVPGRCARPNCRSGAAARRSRIRSRPRPWPHPSAERRAFPAPPRASPRRDERSRGEEETPRPSRQR